MDEAIPILHVADAATAVAWYRRLGYEKEWEHRFQPSFPAFVSLARHGTSRLFLSEHTRDAGGELAAVTTVYIRVRDVDVIAKQFDAEIVEQPWAREVFLTDPDGNRLRIGTRTHSCRAGHSSFGGNDGRHHRDPDSPSDEHR